MFFVSKGNLFEVYIAEYFQMLSFTDPGYYLVLFRVVRWNINDSGGGSVVTQIFIAANIRVMDDEHVS